VGGVYYTPTYIVRTPSGKLLEGQTPQEVGGLTKINQPSKTGRPLTVLDPACGSGSTGSVSPCTLNLRLSLSPIRTTF